MSPLRNNLDRAKQAYEGTRYSGNLALDVLGPTPAVRSSRGYFAPLAIAAALAIGLGVGVFAGRSMQSLPQVATTTDTSVKIGVIPSTAPTTPAKEITVANTDAKTGDQTFTSVAMISALADQNVSVVPNLQSLSASESASETAANSAKGSTASAVNTAVAISAAPMSLMLLSADEYSEQQAASTTSSTTSSTGSQNSSSRSLSNTSSNSASREERS